MSNRRRAIIGIAKSGGGGLPSEYQQVEYIEGTGQQYIDSGVYPDYLTGINSSMTLIGNNYHDEIFGCYSSGGDGYAPADNRYWVRTRNRAFLISSTQVFISLPNNTQINLQYNMGGNQKISVSGVETSLPSPTSTLPISQTLSIFAFHNNGYSGYAHMKVESFKIYHSADLIRDLVPCYRKSDSKPGLYDLVNGTFYTNANTSASTDFVVGHDV